MIIFLTAAVAHAQPVSSSTKLGDVAATAAPVSTVAAGVGNLPPDFYPKSPCVKPDAALMADRPHDVRDVKAIDNYNERVRMYNATAQAFNVCVVDYAAKANNDIGRIQAAIRDANLH